MQGFTDARMIALLVAALEEAPGPAAQAPSAPQTMPAEDGALRPDGEKRRLIAAHLARGGPERLVSVAAEGLRAAPAGPSLDALTRDPDPAVIAAKWMRLERYRHSHHRTRIETAPGRWRCTRSAGADMGAGAGTAAAPAPGLGENALIAGALLGLLRRAGHEAARLEGAAPDMARFELAGLSPPAHPRAATGAEAAARLFDLLAEDPARPWRLQDAARALGLSARSLQRRLAAEGTGFAAALARARLRAALLMLLNGAESAAEIGFAAGFSDQAHMQRAVKRATGRTPGALRAEAVRRAEGGRAGAPEAEPEAAADGAADAGPDATPSAPQFGAFIQ